MAKIDVTLEELLEAGAHFGHQARRWNPKMAPYLYDVRDGIHVFDLAKTREMLLVALEVLTKYAQSGKKILFIGTKKQVKNKVAEVAIEAGQMYVNQRWMGGTLTNFNQILKSLRNLSEMKQKTAKGEYASFTKKERLLIERKIADLEKAFGGIAEMTGLPDLMVIIDIHHEAGAVAEAKKMGVPTIGVVDSNSDPSMVTYAIPMNDDASNSLMFIMEMFRKALVGNKEADEAPKRAKKTKKVVVEKVKESEEEDLS